MDKLLAKLHLPSFGAGIAIAIIGVTAIEIAVKIMTGAL